MIQFFKEKIDFTIPKLFMNMRNSREITEVGKTIRSMLSDYKITDVINSKNVWKSSITSYIPTFIPINVVDLKNNYSKLFKHSTEKGTLRVILLSDESGFDLAKIKEAVLGCGVKEDDILIHTFNSNHSKEDIKAFLRNQKGFLICQEELFTGMEAKSVVYCLNDNNFYNNVRVNVMRACEKLNIIYCYRKDDVFEIDFPSAVLDPTFIKDCEQIMEYRAFQCQTCEDIAKKLGKDKYTEKERWICTSCSLGCHHGHKINWKHVHDDLKRYNINCNCKSEHPICLFKNLI